MNEMQISYKEEKRIDRDSLLNLYNDAGWSSYTNDIERLESGITNSLYVLTARYEDKLIGLLRIVGDGSTIVYIQDILVLSNYRRLKIGSRLVEISLEKFKDVRQKVLLTDDTSQTRNFYESLSFKSCDDGQLVAFIKIGKD